ncbi:MAG TPA: CBS domain-containing protein [Candidatus Omnitrophota bacterium]|nr:CBS domain-containing protein [Candidatus Omnitrophota bacterium]
MNRVLVSDIMTRQITAVSPDTNLLECAKKMVRKRLGSLLLIKDNLLKGFISTDDILWAVVKKSKEDLSKIKASDISPRKIVTIQPDATIDEAIQRIKKFRYHRLPVVKNGEVIGLITIKDILNFYPELNAQLKQVESIREETEKMKRLEGAKERIIIRDGICEECGNRDMLYRVNGVLICASCMSD